MFKLANVFYCYIHIMPVYEIHLSDQQETRLSHFLSFRFVWDTPFCQKTADHSPLYVSRPSAACNNKHSPQQLHQLSLLPILRLLWLTLQVLLHPLQTVSAKSPTPASSSASPSPTVSAITSILPAYGKPSASTSSSQPLPKQPS